MSHSDTWLGILIIAVFWALVSATVLVMSMQEEGTVGSLVLGELVRDGFVGHRHRNRAPFTPPLYLRRANASGYELHPTVIVPCPF